MINVEKVESNNTGNTNSLAVTGFVFSLVSIILTIFSIPGLICSICALSQIKKTKEEGSGLATAGIIISAIVLGFTIIFLFFFVLALIGASYY